MSVIILFLFLEKHELVFLNFYADWCRFSQILAPIFDEAAETLAKEYVCIFVTSYINFFNIYFGEILSLFKLLFF